MPKLSVAALDSRTSGATEPRGRLALLMAASDCEKPLRSSTVPADAVRVLLTDRLLAWPMSMPPACNKVAPLKVCAPLKVKVPVPSLMSWPAPLMGALKLWASLRKKRSVPALLKLAVAKLPLVPPLPICKVDDASTVVLPATCAAPVSTTAVPLVERTVRWPAPPMAPLSVSVPALKAASKFKVAPAITSTKLETVGATLAEVAKVALPRTLNTPVPKALAASAVLSLKVPFSSTVPPLWKLAPLKPMVPVPRSTSWPAPLMRPSATVRVLLVSNTKLAGAAMVMPEVAGMLAAAPWPIDNTPANTLVAPV